jgi:hypothetical protein
MSDETVMTPITLEEGASAPPKVTPAAVAATSAAPTVKLKPVIRKPLIRKPVIGASKPVTLKPAAGTPPAPAAVPEAAAEAAAAPVEPAASAAPEQTPQLKSITSPIAAQATLRKTGIIAEGILTPAQAQAAKTKTSRISLESAIGVAPSVKSAAPMKTIRLRRPTDLPPAPGVTKPAISPLKPAAPAAGSVSAPAPAPAPETPPPAPVSAPASEAPTVLEPVETVPSEAATAVVEPSTTVTQKKTLKLKRPNFKRPTVGGLRKPGTVASAADPVSAEPSDSQVSDLGSVSDLGDVADIPEIKPLASVALPAADDSKTVAGTPAWLNAITLVAGIAALVVAGICTWSLYSQACGPDAGPNGLASFYSETDHSR